MNSEYEEVRDLLIALKKNQNIKSFDASKMVYLSEINSISYQEDEINSISYREDEEPISDKQSLWYRYRECSANVIQQPAVQMI